MNPNLKKNGDGERSDFCRTTRPTNTFPHNETNNDKTARSLRRAVAGRTQALCFAGVSEVAHRRATCNETSAELKTDPLVVSNHYARNKKDKMVR